MFGDKNMLEFCIPFTKNDFYPFYIDAIGVTRCNSSYSIIRPNSPYYCFEYIISGTGYAQQDNQPVFLAKKNDIFILPENHDHHFYTSPENPWFKIWFTCNGEFVYNTLKSYKLENTNLIKDIDLLKYFYQMYNICKNGNTKLEIFNNCSHIFLDIVQTLSLHTQVDIDEKKSSSLAENVKSIIDESNDTYISLSDISKIVYCSIPYIIDSFKAEYDITPHQYIIQKKIQLAKNYLTNTNLPVKDIASKLNFDNAHYFSAFFKSKTNMSPTDFRSKLKKP